MEYKDNILPNEEELKTLKNGYIVAQKNSLNDLNEIYKKMLEERDYLLSQDLSVKHPRLLQNLEQSIANMGAILEASDKEKRGQKSSQNSFSAFRPRTASTDEATNDESLENNQQNGQSEPPKTEENENFEGVTQPSDVPNMNDNANNFSPDESVQQNNGQTNENANSSTTQQAKRQNRGRPFRQNPIAKVFSNFPLNFDKLKEQQKERLSQQSTGKTNNSTPYTQEPSLAQKTLKQNQPRPHYPPCNMPNCAHNEPPFPPEWDSPRPPFPPKPLPSQNECDPHKKIVTKELDIIRLLLLYMALRPNCPYTYRLCTVAQNHLEILGEILERDQSDDWK